MGRRGSGGLGGLEDRGPSFKGLYRWPPERIDCSVNLNSEGMPRPDESGLRGIFNGDKRGCGSVGIIGKG